jgi:hypothetical protein
MSHRCEGRAGQKWGAGAPNQKKCPGGGLEFRCGVAAPQLNKMVYLYQIEYTWNRLIRFWNQFIVFVWNSPKLFFEFHGTSLRGGEPPVIGRSRETTSVPSPVQFHEERIVS